MAQSVKLKDNSYIDASAVYDTAQKSTQESLNTATASLVTGIDTWTEITVGTVVHAWVNKALRIGYLQYNFEGTFPLSAGWAGLGSVPTEYAPKQFVAFIAMHGGSGDKPIMCLLNLDGSITQYNASAITMVSPRGNCYWFF